MRFEKKRTRSQMNAASYYPDIGNGVLFAREINLNNKKKLCFNVCVALFEELINHKRNACTDYVCPNHLKRLYDTRTISRTIYKPWKDRSESNIKQNRICEMCMDERKQSF